MRTASKFGYGLFSGNPAGPPLPLPRHSRARASIGVFVSVVSILAALAMSALKAAAQSEVGEIAPRTAPRTTEGALMVLRNARDSVQKRLANISAQAEPLASAISAYKTDPTAETALALLQREAVVAGVGVKEAAAISEEATAVARACSGLAAQCLAQAQSLRPGLEKAERARADNAVAREGGLNELRALHQTLQARGITNEVGLAPAERRKIAALLRLTGSAELAERFLRMESTSTDVVIQRLTHLGEEFKDRGRAFEDLAAAYKLHQASFATVAGSVGRVAQLIETSGTFAAESSAAATLETELAQVDQILSQTFDSLPDDYTPVLAGTQNPPDSAANTTGLWSRLLRVLGLEKDPAPVVARSGGAQ